MKNRVLTHHIISLQSKLWIGALQFSEIPRGCNLPSKILSFTGQKPLFPPSPCQFCDTSPQVPLSPSSPRRAETPAPEHPRRAMGTDKPFLLLSPLQPMQGPRCNEAGNSGGAETPADSSAWEDLRPSWRPTRPTSESGQRETCRIPTPAKSRQRRPRDEKLSPFSRAAGTR